MDPVEKLRAMRDGLGGIVEMLVALLDTLDGDENLEDSDEDAQVDDERCDERDSGDDEPWLGSGNDCELDDSDDEDGGDYEPNGDERDFDIQDHPHDSDEALV